MNAAPHASRSEAGNALSVWLILFVIIAGGFGALWFLSLADLDAKNQQIADAEEAAAEAEAAESALRGELSAMWDATGFRGEGLTNEAVGASASAMIAKLDTVKAKLGPALGSAETQVTLEEAIDKLMAKVTSLEKRATDAEAAAANETAARSSAVDATRQVEGNYQKQLADLNQQLKDLQDTLDATEGQLTDRIDDLLAQNSAEEDRARQAADDLDVAMADAAKASANADAIIASLKLKREDVEPEAIDGEVLEVTGNGMLAYIDIGKRDGLRRGTRFELLRRGKGGAFEHRGWLEVEEVEKDMALCRAMGTASVFDPHLPGDVIRNPHFERGSSLRYFLHGEFPLNASREFLTQQLRDRGADVDEALGTTTDVLVLGEKNLADEFAPELTDSDEYKLADKLGLRIVRLDELLPFLAF